MRFVLGIDLGTTNIKAVALADDGRLLAQNGEPTASIVPFPGAAEQNPDVIFQQVVRIIRQVCAELQPGNKIAGIVFSGAMHSLIAVGANNQALTNAWLWSDLRAAEFANALRNKESGSAIYRRTGTPIHPMSPLLKIQWLRNNLPEVFGRTRLFLGIKDFVLYKLLGAAVCDASMASATGLLHTVSGQWDQEALEVAGVSGHQLPEVVSPTSIFKLPAATARLLGVPEDTPLIPGASDGALANLGSGAYGPDTLAITIGTSAALRLTVDEPVVDALGRTFCYRLDDRQFIAGGASNNGSNVIDWLRRQVIGARSTPDKLLLKAAKISPGCEGLLFVPYLYGERAPVWDAQAVGIFYGLQARHTRDTMLRAAVEGVGFNLRMIASALPQLDRVREIAFSGGAAASPLWRHALADIFQLPVVTLDDQLPDASALGAVILARRALGLPAMPEPKRDQMVWPRPQNMDIYNAAFARFAHLCGIASTTNGQTRFLPHATIGR